MSSTTENITLKQPIRRLEIQISNFNVAIPHHVDLLKRHKNNIQKYLQQNDWERMHKEHINVSRIVKQLKELLYQMDILRAQVLDSDINQFDKFTASARLSIMNAIKEYLELELNLSASQPGPPKLEDNVIEDPPHSHYVYLQKEQDEIQRQQIFLNAWNSLQGNIQQLHELFVEFNKFVDEQKELVNSAEASIEETQVNVTEGTRYLEKAAKYKTVLYPLAGALLGTCIGGPIGLLAGLKIGGVTAIGCGVLGYTGGSILKKKEIETKKAESTNEKSTTEQKTIQICSPHQVP